MIGPAGPLPFWSAEACFRKTVGAALVAALCTFWRLHHQLTLVTLAVRSATYFGVRGLALALNAEACLRKKR